MYVKELIHQNVNSIRINLAIDLAKYLWERISGNNATQEHAWRNLTTVHWTWESFFSRMINSIGAGYLYANHLGGYLASLSALLVSQFTHHYFCSHHGISNSSCTCWTDLLSAPNNILNRLLGWFHACERLLPTLNLSDPSASRPSKKQFAIC